MPTTEVTPRAGAGGGANKLHGISLTAWRVGFWALGLYPLGRWLWLGATGGLGVNPAEFLIRSSGTWTLVALLVTLTIRPLREITGQTGWLRLRRLCGLFTFFYASLHLLGYLWWDQWFDWWAVAVDAWRRPMITVGWVAWLGLLALALTSTRAAMRRLGRHWQRLHRLIYWVLALAILHFWLHRSGKNDFDDVWIYGALGALLLLWRVVGAHRRGRRAGEARAANRYNRHVP